MQCICTDPRQSVCCRVVDTFNVSDVCGKQRDVVQVTDLSWHVPVELRREGIHQRVVISENMELMVFNEMANVLDQQVHAVTASSSRSKACTVSCFVRPKLC